MSCAGLQRRRQPLQCRAHLKKSFTLRPLWRGAIGQPASDSGVELDGVVTEAAYAVREPEALDPLRHQQVPVIIDSHSLRFGAPTYLMNSRRAALPYLRGR